MCLTAGNRGAILVGMRRREDIEGVRALAVLAVLLFHAGIEQVSGGYVGVDVFFVVSGYLITSLLLIERTGSGRISLSSFYSRRIRRILPVSALVAVTTLVAGWVWLEPIRIRGLTTDLLAVGSFSSNLVFANRGADYLQSALPPSALQHYWSLAVEEQFYMVWPVLVAVACLGVTGARMLRVRIGVVSAVVTVASFTACMRLMQTSQPWAFFSPHTRAFELSIGALFAVLPVTVARRARSVDATLAWVGLVVVVWCVATFDENTRFPGPWAIVPAAATAFVLRGGDAVGWAPVALLRLAPFQWLGSRSYSAYLWHWPILIIAAPAIGRDLTVGEGLACTAIALGLSEFSYRFVENPVRRNVAIRGVRAAVLAVGLIAVVSGTAVVARNNPPEMAYAPEATTPTIPVTVPAPTTTVPGMAELPAKTGPNGMIVQAAKTTGLPANITPSLQSALLDKPVIYSNRCHAGFGRTEPLRCVYGDPESRTVVALYGDSHAAQWFPAFEKIAIKRKWRLMIYTKSGCPPVELLTYNRIIGRTYPECIEWRRQVIEAMRTEGVQVAFVAYFQRSLDAATRKPFWQKQWRDALRGTYATLKSAGIQPVVLEDTPYLDQMIPACLSRNYTAVDRCSPTVGNAYRDDIASMMDDFDAEGENVLWVRQWFCAETVCPTIVGNLLVYRDDNHMTVTYASYIAPLLDADVAPFVEGYSHPR